EYRMSVRMTGPVQRGLPGEEAKVHTKTSSDEATDFTRDAGLPRVALRVGSDKLWEGSQGNFRHVNPVTGRAQATVPLAGPQEVSLAVDAAHEAGPAWRSMPPQQRRDLLLRVADLVAENAEELARINVLETGTPI